MSELTCHDECHRCCSFPGTEATEWLDANQLADVDELEHKKAELEQKITPIMTKIYQQSGGGQPDPEQDSGAPQTPSGGGGGKGGPKIEEVD